MVKIIIAVIAIIQSGIASQYAPNVMERVVANRQGWGQLPVDLPEDVNGYIAVLSCDAIGEMWLVRPEGGKWERFLVADCAGDAETIEWMQRNNILVEVGHETAVRWRTVNKGIKVEVVNEDSANSMYTKRRSEPSNNHRKHNGGNQDEQRRTNRSR